MSRSSWKLDDSGWFGGGAAEVSGARWSGVPGGRVGHSVFSREDGTRRCGSSSPTAQHRAQGRVGVALPAIPDTSQPRRRFTTTSSVPLPVPAPLLPESTRAVAVFDASTRLSPPNWLHHKHGFLSSDYPPDFLRRGHASCQLPPLRSGTASPRAWRPSTSTSSLPIMRSVWTWARLTPMPRSSSSERPSGRSSKAPRIEAP
jgi:hypothetical protein